MSAIAVTGAAGQLGSDLVATLRDQQQAVAPLTHADIELTDPASIAAALDGLNLTAVINCAAYNLVDKAESEPEAAFAINAFGVRNLAQWCGRNQVPLMHISTDHVFGLGSGRSEPWLEDDVPVPVSVYGASKLAGEHFVRSLCPQHWVVRTCGLYGRNATRGKGNFVETMLRLGAERPELKVVDDQTCTPTSTRDLSLMLATLIRTREYGLYHVTNSGGCTWYEFAREILNSIGADQKLRGIRSADYGAAARRPEYSVLDCTRFTVVSGQSCRSWQDALREYLNQRAT